MSESTLWWILAGILVSLELLTGTFYLLMLALGAASAGLCAVAGLGQPLQMGVAALVGGGAVYFWHRRLTHQRALAPAGSASTDLGSLDVGEPVQVHHWDSDGTTRVRYRGSDWMARCHGTEVPAAGLHRIKAIESNHLVLERF